MPIRTRVLCVSRAPSREIAHSALFRAPGWSPSRKSHSHRQPCGKSSATSRIASGRSLRFRSRTATPNTCPGTAMNASSGVAARRIDGHIECEPQCKVDRFFKLIALQPKMPKPFAFFDRSQSHLIRSPVRLACLLPSTGKQGTARFRWVCRCLLRILHRRLQLHQPRPQIRNFRLIRAQSAREARQRGVDAVEKILLVRISCYVAAPYLPIGRTA